jgi:hypothetical protein
MPSPSGAVPDESAAARARHAAAGAARSYRGRRPPSAPLGGITVTAAPALRRDQANMAPAHKAGATLPRFSAYTAVSGHAFSRLTLAIRRRDGANAADHARFDTYWTPVALLPGAAWVRPDPRPADYESGSRLPCVSIVVYLRRSGAYLDCHGLQWTRMDCNPGCNSSVPAQARGPTCLVGAGKLPKS